MLAERAAYKASCIAELQDKRADQEGAGGPQGDDAGTGPRAERAARHARGRQAHRQAGEGVARPARRGPGEEKRVNGTARA